MSTGLQTKSSARRRSDKLSLSYKGRVAETQKQKNNCPKRYPTDNAAYFLFFDDKTCKGFTCPANSSVAMKSTVISKGKAGSGKPDVALAKPVSCKGDCTIKTCCVCDDDGYELDKTGKKCVSKKKTPKTCDTFKECKNEYKLKPNPKTIPCDKDGCDTNTCCVK